jgi:twitching motility protein PilT
MQTGSAHGMQTMDANLATLVRQGIVTMETAIERAGHADELKRLLGLVKAA